MVKKKENNKKFWLAGLLSFVIFLTLFFLVSSQSQFSLVETNGISSIAPTCSAIYDCGVGCVGDFCFAGDLSCDSVCSKFADCYVLFDESDNDLACVVDDTMVSSVVFDHGEIPLGDSFFGGNSNEAQ